jgi:hypothetical protein
MPKSDAPTAREARQATGARPAGSAAPAIDPLPSLDDVAARGTDFAPGMHEVAKKESLVTPGLRVDALAPGDRDACARVVFVASAPVRAWLENASGAELAALGAPARSGALGERGPVCVTKADTIRVAFDAAGAKSPRPPVVRWVAWSSR